MIDVSGHLLILQQVGTQCKVGVLPLPDTLVIDMTSANEAHNFTISQDKAKEYPIIGEGFIYLF